MEFEDRDGNPLQQGGIYLDRGLRNTREHDKILVVSGGNGGAVEVRYLTGGRTERITRPEYTSCSFTPLSRESLRKYADSLAEAATAVRTFLQNS